VKLEKVIALFRPTLQLQKTLIFSFSQSNSNPLFHLYLFKLKDTSSLLMAEGRF
jgi:hypothetical protein